MNRNYDCVFDTPIDRILGYIHLRLPYSHVQERIYKKLLRKFAFIETCIADSDRKDEA